MKAVVTGGSGFIGSHIVQAFLEKKFMVYVLSRGTGIPWRLAEFHDSDSLQIISGCDLRNTSLLRNTMDGIRPDVIVHAASYGVQARHQDSYETVSTNVLGVSSLIEAVLHLDGLKRFIMIGSGFEYEDQGEPIKETARLIPDTLYGASKIAGFTIADFYRREHELPLVTLRPFSVFGPKEDENRLIPFIIRSILNGGPVKISHGLQTRDFLFVSDFVHGVVMAAEGKLGDGEVYNMVSGKSVTVANLARQIINLMEGNVLLDTGKYTSPRKDRVVFCGDASKIERLGWSPAYSLERGLLETIAWYSGNPPRKK